MTPRDDKDLAFSNDYAADDGSTPVFGLSSNAAGQGVRVMDNAYVISLDRIEPKEQVRKDFDPDHIASLGASLREQGLIQPIQVEPHGDGYRIVAGECRYRAAKEIGWTEIECVVKGGNILTQITENTHRQNLSVLELAEAYQEAMDGLDIGQQELAKRLGCSLSTINRAVSALKLPKDCQELIRIHRIPISVVREANKLDDPAQQKDLLKSYVDGGTIQQAQQKASKTKASKPLAQGIKIDERIGDFAIKASSRSRRANYEQMAKALEEAANIARKKSRTKSPKGRAA